ncbi:MAG: undecaprenyl/decaprenyl-phosphate alpha-N-acetylglucosaminyl 1-phosphate transferase [Elainella sp. Prado103]|jgi:UDP-N-acetylmuramyl pentapeptide phosphotransferase/UDP-N-acetylglucosamine-1-phosphate transferase|nr:undecaprenyl/decaprenyl-phosphate alpha-N-acetylglucosaminyl 1-phosphate transferase [Elainella sp. Prado103]
MFLSWYHLLAFSIAGLAVLRIVPVVQSVALKQGWVDRPDARKMHHRPIVRTGGVAICVGTFCSLITIWILQGFSNLSIAETTEIWVVLGGSFSFFVIGLADDLLGLAPITRLVMQVGVASYVWWAGVQIEFVTVPTLGIVQLGWLSLPLTVIWLTGVVNAINWMDGLDGLASGVSGIAAITIFVICLFTNQPVAAVLIAALAGSLLGFLYYNFNPAQIFMGDGGSYFIGFMVAGVSVIGLVKSAIATAVLLPFVILAVPILDMSAVILTRLWHRRSPFTADNRHLHHRLLQAGLSHRSTVYVIYALAWWTGSFAMAFAGIPNSLAIVASATGLLGCTTWRVWQSIKV